MMGSDMAKANGEVGYAPHGDGHLAYRMWGEGPALLYVPSQFIAISDMDDEPAHERFLLSLATFATVIVFDRRGVGLSDPMTEPPTLEGWAGQLGSVLDAAGFDRAYLLAHAAGAMPATMFARQHPDRVAGLILAMAIAVFPHERMLAIGDVRGTAQPGSEPTFDFVAMHAPSRADDPRFRAWFDRAGRRGASPAVAQSLLELHSQGDVTGLDAELRVPTLVIGRPAYSWSPPRPWFGEQAPDTRVVEVAGVDALPWLPDSDAIVAEIEEFATGTRAARTGARSLLAVMFTDVVGSTDAAARLGDEGWRDVLETHDRLLRRELARHGGREIDTAGDGFLATFGTPTAAVRCASRLHRAMAEIGVQLRIGIHCGEVEVRGDDIAGMAVHLASRVESKAAPGQTLMTSTARDAMVGSGVSSTTRGAHELKGIPGSWELFAVDD
jgi:class 3 adenylate cyclase